MPVPCQQVDRRATLLVLVLGGCAMEVEPERINATPGWAVRLELTRVDWSEAKGLIEDVERCVGRQMDLRGWTLHVAGNVIRDACDGLLVFRCPDETPLECRADGHIHCACGGLTHFVDRMVVVAPDRASLAHELIHAGYGVEGHGADPEWECVE